MTDYEMISTFTEFWNLVWVIFAAYVSITFAFLVVGYLISKKLASRMVGLVVGLYTLVALWCMVGINRFVTNAINLANEIKRVVEAGDSSLNWSVIVNQPDLVPTIVPILVMTVVVAGYVAAVVFFFHQRKFRI